MSLNKRSSGYHKTLRGSSRGLFAMVSPRAACAWLLLAWLLSSVDSHVRLRDGGYEDVVVEVTEDVASQDCSAVFKGLEVSIGNTRIVNSSYSGRTLVSELFIIVSVNL